MGRLSRFFHIETPGGREAADERREQDKLAKRHQLEQEIEQRRQSMQRPAEPAPPSRIPTWGRVMLAFVPAVIALAWGLGGGMGLGIALVLVVGAVVGWANWRR